MTTVVRALAKALGLAPRPWSEAQVMRCLRKWLVLQQSRRTGEPGLGRPNPYDEPGWLLLAATIAAKISRCPANTIAECGTSIPAVELVVRAEMELDHMRAVWAQRERAILRAGGQIERAEIARQSREVRRIETLLKKVRDSAAYRRGVEYLATEFAWCARLDGAFRAWASREEGS